MSEFSTLADLFPADRQPTRELETIQKVDRTDQIKRDIDEFIETESARRVLSETADIIVNSGASHRFRYVHATFGSGKSHLLKLIGVATGELEGFESYAHDLANTTTGFKEFRDALSESRIDHLQPLFMNLLDRDRDDTKLPIMLFEELGRRRGYHTSRPWLLEFCWRLDVKHGLWDQLEAHEYEGLSLDEVGDRPASLRPWLRQSVPQLEGADEAGLDTEAAVADAIDTAAAAIAAESFEPEDLVERLIRTKRYLERDGDVYQFLIGLDEIAIYVGDQPQRYEEVVDTITALIDGLNPPILGTGQWPMRDMQQNFIGDINDEAWYAQEIQLQGTDTEVIVRKRWLQKSSEGRAYIESTLLEEAPELDPILDADADPPTHANPAEAYPFRDRDLWLLRAVMQGLIEGDRDTDREYIQGRALLARIRSLFAEHGWATREPGVVVSWDALYDIIKVDTELIPSWASNLINRVDNTFEGDELPTRTAKALFLVSQVDTVPRTPENLARLLAADVYVDLEDRTAEVKNSLERMAGRNLIRKDVDASPTTYTILSEEDIRFWQEVQRAATELPEHQVQSNIQQFIRDGDPDRLTSPGSIEIGAFGNVESIRFTVRYSVGQSIPDSVTEQYDAIVIRLLVHDEATIQTERNHWQTANSDPSGREDVLVTITLTEAIRRRIRQLIGMQTVLKGMADPRPEHRLKRQTMQEELEDELHARLNEADVYIPTRETSYGSYLENFDEAVEDAVDEKFPNRVNIERPLQLDDLEALVEFFQDGGPWPFTEADAERLGVNTVPHTIDDGWVTEFLELDAFEDEDRVSGERVLETINGRRGPFLGTPAEALHALLFVLVADNRIAIREDGKRVTDIDAIARIITRKTRFEDATVEFDPDPPPEDLADVYAALVSEDPETDDTQVLLSELYKWTDRHAAQFKTVVSRTNLEFEARLTLEQLKAALEPAFSDGELNPNQLTNPTVIDQAERYAKAAPLFIPGEDEDEPIWDRFEAAYEQLTDLYPTATITKEMAASANESRIPSKVTLESQLDQVADFRVHRLQTLYRNLTGKSTAEDDLDSLRATVTDKLTSTVLTDDIEMLRATYPAIELAALESLIDDATAATDPLSEAELADPDVRDDAETLANGRALLVTEFEGEPLYNQLAELEAELSESREGYVTTQITKAVRGTAIPDAGRAQPLLAQGRSILGGEERSDDSELEQLWQEIVDHDEGTIVVIDTEDAR